MAKCKCPFSIEGCKGEIEVTENGKTRTGVFTCKICGSIFRLTIVTDKFTKITQKPVPLKQPKVKVVKKKKPKDDDDEV